MCELGALCKNFCGMKCTRDKNRLKCLKVRGENGKPMDIQLNKDYLKKVQKINSY